MNRLLLTIGVLLFLTAACKKADTTTSAEEDLRSGKWMRTSGKMRYKDSITRGDSLKDYTLIEDPCRKDNALIFKEGNVGSIDHGSAHCAGAVETTNDFNWYISKDEKHISLYGVADYFPINNVDAEILTRTLGYLTIQYQSVTADALHGTYDTLTYIDVFRR